MGGKIPALQILSPKQVFLISLILVLLPNATFQEITSGTEDSNKVPGIDATTGSETSTTAGTTAPTITHSTTFAPTTTDSTTVTPTTTKSTTVAPTTTISTTVAPTMINSTTTASSGSSSTTSTSTKANCEETKTPGRFLDGTIANKRWYWFCYFDENGDFIAVHLRCPNQRIFDGKYCVGPT